MSRVTFGVTVTVGVTVTIAFTVVVDILVFKPAVGPRESKLLQ